MEPNESPHKETVEDAVVIRGTGVDQDDLVSVLKSALDRAAELAMRRNLVPPFRIALTDADMCCLLTVTTNCNESAWTGRIEPGEVDTRRGIAFPWLLVLEDSAGEGLKIRIELDPRPE